MGNQSIIGLTHNVSFKNGDDPVMNGQMERIQGILTYYKSYLKYVHKSNTIRVIQSITLLSYTR